MEKKKLKSKEDKLSLRNSSLDIIRIFAVFMVMSVHFFLHNGFYNQTVEGVPMFIACLMRTLFTVCVPLFIVLTGYLMSKKELSKKYYSGIVKTLVVFIIATIACMIYKAIAKDGAFDFKSLLLSILDFSGANYSWYIEMYIGLFLIAPFLNLAYGKLASQKQKQILIATFIGLTILPSLFNIYNFETAQWWGNPTTSDEFSKLIPSWWSGFYPVTYYFVGAYLREYKLKVKTSTLAILTGVSLLVFGSFNFYRSYGGNFKSGSYIQWGGIESFVLAVFIFILLSRINTEKIPAKARKNLWKLSDVVLGAYLISYIFDTLLYPILCDKVVEFAYRLPYYFIIVPSVFILSMASSAIMNLIAKFIILGVKKLVVLIKSEIKKGNKAMWQWIAFGALMLGSLIFSFWKCMYGLGGNDEAFYLTIPHRLITGDAFIVDEWNLTQLSGFLLMPFVWLYTAITQSTEGIMLTARILYVIIHAVITTVIYTRLRRHGYIAVIGCVLFFLFTPYDIMAMSYNTMGLDLTVLTGVIMGTTSYKKKLPLIISGVTFVGAVLCNPYLAIAYILFAVGVVVHFVLKKTKFNKNVFSTDLFAVKTFLWFTVGVAILAVIFLSFALSRASISEIITNLPYIMADPEHPQLGIFEKLGLYFNGIWECQETFKISIITYGVTLLVMALDRKRRNHRSLYLIVTTAVVIMSLVMFFPEMTSKYYNTIMFPMLFIGITSYILTEKKNRTLFASLFVLGILYSFAMSFSLNQYFYVIAVAMASSNVASYVFLSALIKEMRETPDNLDYPKLCKYTSFAMVAFVLLLQSCFQINVKAIHCFWDGSTDTLTSQITSGPAKGIVTTESNKLNYTDIYLDLQSYQNEEKGNILCLTGKAWTYLALNDYSYGTFSAWLSGETESTIDRLESFYAVNPDKKPKYIYIPKQSDWDFTNINDLSVAYGYSVQETSVSYKLEKIN